MSITSEQIMELKKLSKEALKGDCGPGEMQGPWRIHEPSSTFGWGYCVGPNSYCHFQLRGRYPKKQKITNAKYLAAVSPDVILALIAEIERLREITGKSD